MRRFVLTFIFASLACPVSAIAGTSVTTFTAAQEQGVIVYRGQPSAHNYQVIAAQQRAHKQREEQVKINSRLAAQDRAIAAQQRSIDALEAQQTKQQAQPESNPSGRFGRTYRGNNRFFGQNGFIGNSNFSGATQPLPPKYRRLYKRKIR